MEDKDEEILEMAKKEDKEEKEKILVVEERLRDRWDCESILSEFKNSR